MKHIKSFNEIISESIYHVGKIKGFTFDQLKQGEMYVRIVEQYRKYLGSLIVKKWNLTESKKVTNNQIDVHWWKFREDNIVELLCSLAGMGDEGEDLIFELTQEEINSGKPTPLREISNLRIPQSQVDRLKSK